MGKKILVIGSLNMDMVIPVKELPQKGETILGGSPAHIPGGKGANQACAAGKLGGAVTMLGKVGQDGMGRALKENLAAAGVEVTHVEETPDAPTGMAVIYVGETGSNSIVVIPGANGLCDAAFIEANEELIAAHDIIVLQLEIPYDGVFRAIQLAKKHGRLVVLNPAPAPDSLPPEVIASLDYFTPNETEMARIAGLPVGGVEEAIAAGKKLVEAGVGTVLATLGEAGALLVTKETAHPAGTGSGYHRRRGHLQRGLCHRPGGGNEPGGGHRLWQQGRLHLGDPQGGPDLHPQPGRGGALWGLSKVLAALNQ